MAEMIPESIASIKEATAGEKRVYRVLRDALRPDEDYIVWFEPKAVKMRPDFLVWAQDLGLLIIEVKDWVASQISYDSVQGQIIQASPDRWTVTMRGVEQTHDSPVEQARRCYIKYKELIQKYPNLRHQAGAYHGNVKFPIGYCAAFTQITRKQAEEKGILQALGATYCLFSEDLTDDFESRESRRAFVSKLKRAYPAWFSFDPLSAGELNALRYVIFPEVRIHSTRATLPVRTAEQSDMIRTLDLQQERTAKSILEGHRVLKGVAGSGKTLVITCRAKYLKKIQPEWKILIVCFNISLCQYIQQLLAVSELYSDTSGIQVHHYHGLIKALTGANMRRFDLETSEEWEARMCAILRHAIATGTSTTKYDAILIDEGQDFAVEWLRSLTELLDEHSDSLLLCLDPAQNIFGRTATYKSAGINVIGKKPVTLLKSYRNTSEILSLARKFSKVQDTLPDPDEETTMESLLFPIDVDRHGQPPRIICELHAPGQIQFILDEIEAHIANRTANWHDIAVIYTSRFYAGFVERFKTAFRERFGADKLYWVSESQKSKMASNLSAPSVKLSTIESAKGLEFRIVFLVGIEMLPRPNCDESSERKLAYVGLTRAQDLLYVLGSAATGLFQELLEIVQAETT